MFFSFGFGAGQGSLIRGLKRNLGLSGTGMVRDWVCTGLGLYGSVFVRVWVRVGTRLG